MYGDGEWDEEDVKEEKNKTNQPSPPCTVGSSSSCTPPGRDRRGEEKHHKPKDSPAERLKSTRKTIALAQDTLYP
jgi:hypothetical protein